MNTEGLKVAVIVNDMSEVNIDAKLVKQLQSAMRRVDEKLVEFFEWLYLLHASRGPAD
jgi:G3E family GTPase